MKSCREFKELFVDVRERVNRVLGFAKILRKVRHLGWIQLADGLRGYVCAKQFVSCDLGGGGTFRNSLMSGMCFSTPVWGHAPQENFDALRLILRYSGSIIVMKTLGEGC